MVERHLVYFADPMCSWCYGFAATIAAIRGHYGDALNIRAIMGGLRPGTTEAMEDKAKASLRGHWVHVTEASGQPFGPSGMDEDGFVYDTDPAARAVVLMRRRHPDYTLDFLEAAQKAFYAGGMNITRAEVLGALAALYGEDPDEFAAALADEGLKRETWRDYAISQNAGIKGFPALIVGPMADGTYTAVARGFQPPQAVLPLVQACLEAA